MSAPILSLRGINKSFGPVHVLRNVDFDAHAGKVTALVGDNGAGKSTLIKCIAGIYIPEQGEFSFEGKKVTIGGPRDATALGIEIVYQDLALCDNLDIVHNMFLGREEKSAMTLDESKMESMAKKTLESLSVRTVKSIRQKVESLSGGQRQTVAIARAVLWNSKVVILDEPTASLNRGEVDALFREVRRVAELGIGVLFVSHALDEVLELADRVTVLRDGNVVAAGVDAATLDAASG